ncbi:MAG: rhamnogalacturonan lyase [Actinomycetales bacterium]|nr:rhamnogalacturonan lyase [Actinomycetales bacterium]
MRTFVNGRRSCVAVVAALVLPVSGVVVAGVVTAGGAQAASARQAERLDRGVVSVRSGSANLVSWRLLGTDPQDVAFNVYRGGSRVNSSPVTGATNYLDSGAAVGVAYTVRAVVNGSEQSDSAPALQFGSGYLDVPISPPGGSYTANDASVGDLDGDGQLEIVLKWYPNNAQDNANSGVTDPTYLDGVKLNGTRLWRINLGRNIRSGAHYTQFQVYDYDGDGKAEMAVKTADGTVDGTGKVIGNAGANYVNSSGYILSGPEYLTMFNGQTGAAMSTVDYDPPRGTVSSWGDSYGNRVDRFLAATAYLDGVHPSLVMCRGYYTRAVLAAWDFRGGQLVHRWTFDSNSNTSYAGQGNHNLSVADADGDGRDEIIYGAAAIDDNGTGLWNTRLGHGDAMHVGDLVPSRSGLEMFKVQESNSTIAAMVDLRNGSVIWGHTGGGDNGRGVAGDVYAGSPGAEAWSSGESNLFSGASGSSVGSKPGSANFLVWWDGDTTRELEDGTSITKYGSGTLLSASGVHSNNGTKSNPSLVGDILGDWREEVIWPTSSNTALRIYSTPHLTGTRIPTLLHDPMYRVALAWQNTAYNQPPHPSFHIGNGMSPAPWPNVYVPGGTTTTQQTTTTTRQQTTTTTMTTAPRTTTTTTAPRTTTTTTSSGGGGGTCTASYAVASSWPGGFVANVNVTAGSSAITGWRVTMTLPSGAAISNIWNGVNSGTSGTVTVTNQNYNGSLGAGQSTSFGFQGTGTGSGATVSCTAG